MSKEKLLLVEDDVNFGFVLKSYLEMNDFYVTLITDGKDAVNAFLSREYNLCILDVMLPNVDGFTIAKEIKRISPSCPVIFLTARSLKEDIMEGFRIGADDYLTKPFDMDILRLRLKTIVRNRQLTKSKIINSLSHGTPVELGNKQNDEFVQKLHLTVKENMGNSDFDKEQFAAAMNVSSSLLYKKIKALTDLSPTDFIKTARLEYAQQLLKSQRYNITEISEMCGFASAAYFSTVFKKQYGVAPSEFNGTE